MEKLTQTILPDDVFSGVAVEQYLDEHEVDQLVKSSLIHTAHSLEKNEHAPDKMDRMRGFLAAMIGFGKA